MLHLTAYFLDHQKAKFLPTSCQAIGLQSYRSFPEIQFRNRMYPNCGWINCLTLINAGVGGRGDHHPPTENRVFSPTEHRMNLRPVCKFEFVRCGPVEKKEERSICLGLVVGVANFADFHQNSQIFKNFSGDKFKS